MTVRSVNPLRSLQCAASFYHEAEGHKSPSADPRFSRLMGAFRRDFATPPDQMDPLLPDVIRRLMNQFWKEEDEEKGCHISKWRTLFIAVLSFHSAARFSDLAHLSRDSIRIDTSKNILYIHFGLSKTNRFRAHDKIDIIHGSSSKYCPVAFAKRYLHHLSAIYPLPLHSPLLPNCASAGKTVVSYNAALKSFRALLAAIGEDADSYGLHSGRIGAHVMMQKAGLSDVVRRHKGRYALTSCMPDYYTRFSPRWEETVATSRALLV